MTKLVVISRNEDWSDVIPAIGKIAPDLLFVAADAPEAQDAEVAICWNPPPGALAALPKLKLVHALAAGGWRLASTILFPIPPIRHPFHFAASSTPNKPGA